MQMSPPDDKIADALENSCNKLRLSSRLRYFSPSVPVSTGQQAVIPEVVLAPPTLPGFYPHSEWAALGPVHVGVRSKPRPHHWVMGPGLFGCCHLIGDL